MHNEILDTMLSVQVGEAGLPCLIRKEGKDGVEMAFVSLPPSFATGLWRYGQSVAAAAAVRSAPGLGEGVGGWER